jgi:photosystem II stability/assembly factor-like uncharacterized protein
LAGVDGHQLLPSSQVGVFRSDDGGTTWENLDAPTAGLEIWSVTVDPTDPDTLFVGTRPEGFRSRDGGRTWNKLQMGVNMKTPLSPALPDSPPRTTCMMVDPRDNHTIWAGMEVDGVYKSLDGGDSWVHLPDLGPDPFHGDIHGMALKTGAGSSVYCTSPFGIATSEDEGESWDYHYFPKFNENDARSYCRGMLIKADAPDVMFVGNGDMIPGMSGVVQRTKNAGRSWEPVSLPVEPNSLIYWLGTHPERPNVIVAASLFGYLYVSEDGGDEWRKLPKEFGEIRTVAVLPN